ncbi:MAG: fatty acid desaturase [bacterium]|nr:fatty acid desaturase [bacterium]
MTDKATKRRKSWTEKLAKYARPSTGRSLFQLSNTALLFGLAWLVMLGSLRISYWLTLALAIPAAGFLVRLFIIQHDCGHGSFFRSRAANNALGFAIGVLTLTPYGYWRRTHAIHHATAGNLDQRGLGDVNTLTVKEYLARSRWGRFRYRLYRHPIVLFGVGPIYEFILKHRLPLGAPFTWKKEWASVIWTNVVIASVIALMWLTIGIKPFLAVQVPITLLAGSAGVWLFYVQHQFEDTYWDGGGSWNFQTAGMHGSSYYDLPRVLHWFTGNIAVHHVHHLSSRIPNYRLLQCLRENPELQQVTRLTLWQSLKCVRLKLWDEDNKKLVGFRSLRRLRSGS